ncbi:hypothetical protein ACQ4M3_41570 [Leptolyngbya sp. AN03gr2]|uniref:hypothetical protein n=1 Tax=unclassified Leptolyngbya TaxID=2650499 RepID=UPI003D31029F
MKTENTTNWLDFHFQDRFSLHEDTQSIYFNLEPFDVNEVQEFAFEVLGTWMDDESIHEIARCYAAKNTYASLEEELKAAIADWYS